MKNTDLHLKNSIFEMLDCIIKDINFRYEYRIVVPLFGAVKLIIFFQFWHRAFS